MSRLNNYHKNFLFYKNLCITNKRITPPYNNILYKNIPKLNSNNSNNNIDHNLSELKFLEQFYEKIKNDKKYNIKY